MRLVFIGLTLSSSWGNGHATTYRSLLRGLAGRGHEVLFLEREQPWYAANRDLARPEFCSLSFYSSVGALGRFADAIAQADAVIIGSYVPDGPGVIDLVYGLRRGLLCFYDIDTPVTLAKLANGDAEYLTPDRIPLFDLYLSFTGGPLLDLLKRQYAASRACALYCSVDPTAYRPIAGPRRWDLGYLGTYSADRQDSLDRLLVEPARRLPERRFVVAGSQFPSGIVWPDNVERIEHLSPSQHALFYSSLGWTLNVTRGDMVRAGYSPSVRLFEATACGVPVIADIWSGLDDAFTPGVELLTAATTDDVLAALATPEHQRRHIADAGRRKTLSQHTSDHRAETLEQLLIASRPAPRATRPAITDWDASALSQ
jgi:spore maturation protein CgeB